MWWVSNRFFGEESVQVWKIRKHIVENLKYDRSD